MKYFIVLFLPIVLASCSQHAARLPILGNPEIKGQDTVYPVIAPFSVTDQDSNTVTNQTFNDKIYVADFIFLSCPSICPKLTSAMYSTLLPFANNNRVAFISYSIDAGRDTVPRLRAYAEKLGVKSQKWHFVTGSQDSILKLANKSYFSTAYRDSSAPGGFAHSGGLLLVDKNRHIRGVYNGTDPQETERLINDIQILLKEQF